MKYTTLNNIMKFFKAERKTKYQCIDKPHQIISRWEKKTTKYYITLFSERPTFQLN